MPSSFDVTKESEAKLSEFFILSATRVASVAFGGLDSADFIAAPGANKAIVIEWLDWIPLTTASVRWGLVDGDGTVLWRGKQWSSGANAANNFRNLTRRVTANKYVRIKNLEDSAGTLDIEASIGYRIVEEY